MKYKKIDYFAVSFMCIICIFDMQVYENLKTYSIKGYVIILLGMIVLLESFAIKNKILASIGYIMSIIGYLISFSYIFKYIDFSKANSELELIILSFTISFISLIVSLFYKMDTRKYSIVNFFLL